MRRARQEGFSEAYGRGERRRKERKTILFQEFYTNEHKSQCVDTSTGRYARHAIRTHFVGLGEDLNELVERYVLPVWEPGDIVAVSEKIVSLCQGRIVRKEDMKLTPLARFLSRFASSSEAGIGVDCVWKMQFAIDHCGRGRVLLAAVCAGVGKLFGRRGVFYDIAGEEVRGLDGFYGKAYPQYEAFGIRLPEDPDGVCAGIYRRTGVPLTVVDANDFTRDILGVWPGCPYSEEELAEMIRDNPAGQSAQQTPFILIRRAD